MRILVEKITDRNLNILVEFSSEFGKAVAFWEGEKPIANNEYHVEMDIRDTLIWNEQIQKAENNKHYIQQENDLIRIFGRIDSIDDDGYVTLRLGECIVPFIASGTPFQIGEHITLSAKEIFLSPVDY